MPRVAVLLTEPQHNNLKSYAVKNRTTMDKIIRQAIAEFTRKAVRGPQTEEQKAEIREKKRVANLCAAKARELYAPGAEFTPAQFRARLLKSLSGSTKPTLEEVRNFDQESYYNLLRERSGTGKIFEAVRSNVYTVRSSQSKASPRRSKEKMI